MRKRPAARSLWQPHLPCITLETPESASPIEQGASMSSRSAVRLCCLAACLIFIALRPAVAQVPTPSSVLGHTPGDDFYLADYEDTVRYFHALAAAAPDRLKMF